MHITFDTVRILYCWLLNGREILFFIGQFLGLVEGWYLKLIFILKYISTAFMNTQSVTYVLPPSPPSVFVAAAAAGRDIWV